MQSAQPEQAWNLVIESGFQFFSFFFLFYTAWIWGEGRKKISFSHHCCLKVILTFFSFKEFEVPWDCLLQYSLITIIAQDKMLVKKVLPHKFRFPEEMYCFIWVLKKRTWHRLGIVFVQVLSVLKHANFKYLVRWKYEVESV